jgi:hypothetical protein
VLDSLLVVGSGWGLQHDSAPQRHDCSGCCLFNLACGSLITMPQFLCMLMRCAYGSKAEMQRAPVIHGHEA